MSDHLKEYTNATGVYFAQQRLKSKVNEDSEHTYEPPFTTDKNIRFMAADDVHQFMLENEQGTDSVVGSMFEKKAEEGVEQPEEEVAEGDKKKKVGK